MSLEPFIPQRKLPRKTASLTIRSDGRFTFNVAASRVLAGFHTRHVQLFGDRDTKTVEIRPCSTEPSVKCVRITIVRLSDSSCRASLEGAAFLDWIGYDYATVRRFQLACTATALSFVATPDCAVANPRLTAPDTDFACLKEQP